MRACVRACVHQREKEREKVRESDRTNVVRRNEREGGEGESHRE